MPSHVFSKISPVATLTLTESFLRSVPISRVDGEGNQTANAAAAHRALVRAMCEPTGVLTACRSPRRSSLSSPSPHMCDSWHRALPRRLAGQDFLNELPRHLDGRQACPSFPPRVGGDHPESEVCCNVEKSNAAGAVQEYLPVSLLALRERRRDSKGLDSRPVRDARILPSSRSSGSNGGDSRLCRETNPTTSPPA